MGEMDINLLGFVHYTMAVKTLFQLSASYAWEQGSLAIAREHIGQGYTCKTAFARLATEN